MSHQFIGPPLGAALFTVFAGAPLVIDAVSFMAAAVLVLTIHARHTAARPDRTTTIRADIGEGVRWLWRHHGLRLLALELGLANLTHTMGTTMLVLLIVKVLHGPAAITHQITGQEISSLSLPEFAQEHISEEVALTQGLGEIEEISRGAGKSIMLSPPGSQALLTLWNDERGPDSHITRLYWKASRATIAGVVVSVRTALAELVGELLAAATDDNQTPSKQAADAAVHFIVTGNRNTVTVVGSQVSINGDSAITITGSADQSKPDKETWWQRWRKRGLLIGLATVVAAVAAVLQLVGWVPWH